MWERGDKTNQGITEINASSIGMAKVHTHQHTHTHTHTHRNTQKHTVLLYFLVLERAGRRRRNQLLSAEREQRQNRWSSKKKKSLAGWKVSSHCDGLYADLLDDLDTPD